MKNTTKHLNIRTEKWGAKNGKKISKVAQWMLSNEPPLFDTSSLSVKELASMHRAIMK